MIIPHLAATRKKQQQDLQRHRASGCDTASRAVTTGNSQGEEQAGDKVGKVG